jgi:hypothetical protein
VNAWKLLKIISMRNSGSGHDAARKGDAMLIECRPIDGHVCYVSQRDFSIIDGLAANRIGEVESEADVPKGAYILRLTCILAKGETMKLDDGWPKPPTPLPPGD